MKLKSLTDKFLITNIEEVEEFDRRDLDHQYSIEEAEEFHRHVPGHK